MKSRNIHISIFLIFSFLIIIINISFIKSKLKCEPDFKSYGDNYNSLNDPQDVSEFFYGYEFAHRAGNGNNEYYDKWKGIYWDEEQFCYDAYDNTTRPIDNLDELGLYRIKQINVITNPDEIPSVDDYIVIEHDQTNLISLHNQICMTKQHPLSKYNNGEYELLVKMDKLFEKNFIGKPYHFYFSIENPSEDNVTFAFKVRNFVNTTEYMNTTLYERGPDPNQCLEEETNSNPESPDDDQNESNDGEVTAIISDEISAEETDPPTQEPCEREIIILNETFLEWTEEYPIPELFYITNNYTIKPHSSLTVNVSLSFKKNNNETEGGYFVISEETGESEEPFYWPEIIENNGKLKKLTNMEIILESDLPIGLSSYSLMRRRENDLESYLGNECYYDDNKKVLNGTCGDGYFCNNKNKCEKCSKIECKECDSKDGSCSKCFLISVDNQWNPPGGRGSNLNCDLDFIDITKVKINGQNPIEVPPAIHWRVTMDFWIWISDADILRDSKTNMNIVYKDFMAITLRCTQDGLKIFATPLEYLYEYPTINENKKNTNIYKTHVQTMREKDTVDFLTNIVGSYKKVTLEDIIINPTSNWVYIRFAFNLDSSKMYLNDLPESNLKITQIFTDQTEMPFHMKKFYGTHDMTYLYFQNFYHPLSEQKEREGKNITIYLRNLNIFREYMPQNIITKYYNLHLIDSPLIFPQLMVSFPFSGLTKTEQNRKYKMKGYNYYVRQRKTGIVLEEKSEAPKITEYELELDRNIYTLRPPRNFWRLNLLDLNKQPENCEFQKYIDLECNSPSDTCFEDNKPFICEDGTDERPYYLDINNLKCQQFCEFGYMHPPRYSSKNKRLYCSHLCDTGSKQCPSDDYKYIDIYTNFLCSNNFFNLYYKCFNKEESLNNADFGGIFFSKFLRTPSIFINLEKEYLEFAIDFWYFPDNRFRNMRYPDPDDRNYNPLDHQKPSSEKERIIFLSDCCKVIYGSEGSSNGMIQFFVGESTSSRSAENNIDPLNWNHFVLTYFHSLQNNIYTYYLTFRNNQFYKGGSNIEINYYNWDAPSNVVLSQIIFCNYDENLQVGKNILRKECEKAEWLDGFYRKLQIFDLTYTTKHAIFFSHQFEDDGINGMLKHRYIYGLNTVIGNHLVDLIGGKNGYVPWVYDTIASQNPDRTNYIIYQTNYSPDGGIPSWGSAQYITGYTYKPPELSLRKNTGNSENCLISQNGYCLACKSGYSLFSRNCKGDVNNNNKRAQYYYKNPGKNMPERLSLNLDFEKIKNSPSFTFFFFIKIYGFVKDIPSKKDGFIKLLIFHEERDAKGIITEDFYLAWTPSQDLQERMYFFYNGNILFSYPYYRENNFAQWIPISFAAFRESDRLFQLNMVQASIHYTNLGLDTTQYGYAYNSNRYFPYIKFTQFTITNNWVGLLSDIKVYNKFIINAWAIIRYQYYTVENAVDDIPDSAIFEIDLRSEEEGNCLLFSQILNQPASGYKIECVNDYNPHLTRCNSMEFVVRYDQGDIYSICSYYYSCSSYSLNRCLGSYHSCETQSPVWRNYYPALYSNNRIECNTVRYIDYNRFKYARAGNVFSPKDVWAIDFWFYTSTCDALITRTSKSTLGLPQSANNNNFKEFTLEWNYHIKIKVYTKKKDDDPTDGSYNYIIDCMPIVVLEHPDLGSPEIYSNNIGDRHYKWSYAACGVNFQEKIFYLTNNNKFSNEMQFTTKLVDIPSDRTYFVLKEKSPSGYGFTFIHQIRLWHCYNCAHSFRNLDYVKEDKNFNTVYHNFDGVNLNYYGASTIMYFEDSAGDAEIYYMRQVADFPGYTIRRTYDDPTLCDETYFNYYDEESNQCRRHYNIARIRNEFKRLIPSSRNGRYAIELWFFIENSGELSPGVNILWEKHMSISLLRDTSNLKTINAICFPQSYMDNVDGKGGQEIINLYDKALNKDKYSFYQSSSIWNFVRCSVDQTRKLYYINDNIQLDLEGEILYGTTRNYRPFRYFKINEKHYLKFQNSYANPTRIFLRNIKCYRDFIDYRLINMKYLRCGTSTYSWTYCNFWPLSFCFDFNDYDIGGFPCYNSRSCFKCSSTSSYCGLVYFIFEENNDQIISASSLRFYDLFNDEDDVYYPTFPDIYLPYFCDHGQSGGDKIKCSSTISYCHIQNVYDLFWPENNGFYLNLNTLRQTRYCTDACRPPDTYYFRAYCLIEKKTNNMLNCEYDSVNAQGYTKYEANYECSPGYVKVYYECIDENIVKNSAMYFSNIYSFPNVVFSPSNKALENAPYQYWKDETRIPSYYVEIWIKFDALNYRNEITEKEHYLYAYPHQIIKDPNDQKYKYSNLVISQGSFYYNLNSINNYEWNKIIIENIYDPDTKLFHIKFFLNFEFDNPEFSILDLDSNIYKLHFRGFGFCDKSDSYCRINDEPAYLRWGVAWYRNFRVWDADITSLPLIQACEYGYTQLINAQKYYFPLTIDYIYRNTIKDRIDPKNQMKLNYWSFYTGNDYNSAFDDAMRENYSTDNFDKTYIEENNYISGIKEDGTDYIISACSLECKRCYSSSNNDCYECRNGYSIYGKQCKARTGYFFKTPTENSSIRKIEIKTKQNDDDVNFNINEINPLTITIYIKFFGIDLSQVESSKNYYPFFCLYNNENNKCGTFIGYNYDDKTLVFYYKNKEIYSTKAKPYIGMWTHFGISIHHKLNNDHFPNMLNFMIDQQILSPKNSFNPTTEEVNINTFTIYTEPVCYYSSFKIFSSFFFGPYGHVNAISNTRNNKLVYQIKLYGSTNNNCISIDDLEESVPPITIKFLSPVCVPDYHPYEDINNICSDNAHYIDVIYKTIPPCELCDNICMTNCFNSKNNECTCDYYEGLYWVKTDINYQSYECQKVDSINFAFFEKVTLYGINVVNNDEMTMAFWLDIYEYIDNKFDSLEIIWNQHLAVIIKGNNKGGSNKFIEIECHGDYDIDYPEMTHSITYDKNNLKFNRWNYIVCQADKYRNLIRVNGLQSEEYIPVTYTKKLLTSSLSIEDKTKNFNYGFSFVRELKLYNSFNFDFWNESLHHLKKDHFPFLLHYFNNRFDEEKLSNSKITDEIDGLVTKLKMKNDRIGYNYIIDYKYLVICEEGYIYNENTGNCIIFDSQNCYIARNSDDNCLICNLLKPYLKDDDNCYLDCGPNYFGDDYFQQCRKCHYTCFTCFAKFHNNCLSCTGIYYYIESLHICVTNCQEYGLAISKTKNNTCQELFSESFITIPVYLNNSYDYNPKNEDFISKIINRDNFNEIEGHLRNVSSDVNTKWIFNWNKTIELNKKYRYFSIDDFPDEDPIIEDSSNLNIKLNNNYFKYGYKYVFDLIIYSENEKFSINNTHTYILMMNDYPLVGKINILPSRGYITNLFLITINKCTDDISEKSRLKYKFTYFTKKNEVIDGYRNTTENEIIIQDWSSNSELLYKFPELNPLEDNIYYIRGYCKDEFGLFYSEIQEVEVYDIPTNSRIDIPLEEALKYIDLDEDLTPEQLNNRAEFLATITIDFDKKIKILNRTNVTDFNPKGIWQQNLILYDPTSSQRDLFCNYRGNSYVEYYYLICDCNDYEGRTCQIDYPSFDIVIEMYNKLFYKVKSLQTIHFNKYLINSVNLLMRSGAAFMPVENLDFMLESIDFINLYRNKFPDKMIEGNNYEIYFDIYNSLIEYGLSIVNKFKYRNFISLNSKNSENLYNSAKFRNATLNKYQIDTVQNYFNKVKKSLQSLLDFYAVNKKNLRFINRNINVYVQLINSDFDFNSFFNIEKKIYEPYINFQHCLEKTMIKGQENPSYRVFLLAIIWKVSPYMSNPELYWLTSSPISTFKFLDYDKGEKIYLSNCGNLEDNIQLYFPVNTYRYIEKINEKREYLSPENQFDLNDDIFCDPVYINKSGAVFNSTPEERINKYVLGFNFSCKYYKISPEDQNNIQLNEENLDYHIYTKENYIQCLTNKLIQESYSEFVVDSYIISDDFHINSRFFYLKHYMLLFWKENYNKNQAFYYFIALLIFYASMSLGYIYFEKKHFIEMKKIGSLTTEVAKINIPYRNEYIFNNDLKLLEETKGKLRKKRKPDMEEMNLDTNNINIGIMADEITKYNKGYKDMDQNALGFNPHYFGIKEIPKTKINTKFFPGEIDLKKKSDNEEITPEHLEKIKDFYQVGFKGLNYKETIKKEMKLNEDKKKIIIGKKEELDEISEIEEEELYEGPFNSKYFRGDNINDEKEKETTIFKKSKKKKFADNMKQYKNFINFSEVPDTESQLKSSRNSKRESSTKKFFLQNPPKKGAGVISSIIFSEKEAQKIANSASPFYEKKLDEVQNNNNKANNKAKNIFQSGYDNLYKAKFNGPKVISENLGFYNNDMLEFEQNMDSENKNPPYFGTRLKKLKNDPERGKGQNPEIKIGFYSKGKQIDLNNDEEELPELAVELTFEKRLEEFHDYAVTFSSFLIQNIISRHILITTFDKMSILYERYQRVGNFVAQLAMFAFFMSIFFTADASQIAYVTGEKSQILNFVLYCFLADILGCVVVHLPAYCFWINDKKLRRLYNTIRVDGGLKVLKQTDQIVNKGRIFWKILGFIIQIIYISSGFYFSFGFCATYYYQRSTYFLSLICTVLLDFFVSEFAWEILIAFLFYFRDCGRIILFFGVLLNKLRDINHLSQ